MVRGAARAAHLLTVIATWSGGNEAGEQSPLLRLAPLVPATCLDNLVAAQAFVRG